MKIFAGALALALGHAAVVLAEPLQKGCVAGDSKWLLHIDLDNFRSTKVGQLAMKHVLDEVLADIKNKSKLDLGPLIQRIRSVTAYGTDFDHEPDANGILMVQADAEAMKIFEGLLAAQMLSDSNASVSKVSDAATPLYTLNKELFIGIEPKNLVLLGKSRKQVEKAQSVLNGKTKSVASTKAFSDLLPESKSFFFLAVADGLSSAQNAPAQAKVLQMAEGGRIMLGETENKLVAELVLKAKSAQVVGQIQAVLQGMIALASLSQSDNHELQRLIQGINVSSAGDIVTIKLQYPLGEALKKLEGEIEDRARIDGKSPTQSETNPPNQSN
ncbi:MAG: hypothetical protein O2960_08835 [Verrucomicrobia bacterium]|nr:hypothetical protein [Verrucomicrobiota bacterium]